MDAREWEAIQLNEHLLYPYVNVEELVNYLRLDHVLSVEERLELEEFEQNHLKNLLRYLRFKPHGYKLLCRALDACSQAYLVQAMDRSKARVRQVDLPEIYIPESRTELFHTITTKLRTTQCYINLKGEQGVGTSLFMKQICSFLQKSCYFTVFTIDLTDTPLTLQRRLYSQFKHDIIAKEKAMKKYCVLCIDNVNSALLAQLPKYQTHQRKFIGMCIATAKKDLGISFIMTSSQPSDSLENFHIDRLTCGEMGHDIQRIFPDISETERGDLVKIFGERCNPLDCFLASTYYLLHGKHIAPLEKHLHRYGWEREHMFAAVFNKLTRTQQNIMFAIYALPCNAKMTVPYIINLFEGSNRAPEEKQLELVESELEYLAKLNLIKKRNDQRFCMKDSNFYYHFRAFFEKVHMNKLRDYYVRGLHHYLDYVIKVIQDINSLNDFSKAQHDEWQETIPCVALVLNPINKNLEEEVLKKRDLANPVYQKRIFSVVKLTNIASDIPRETLILSAHNLLNNFDAYHHKYCRPEDKVKLLCLINDLTFTPTCNLSDARENLYNALKEVQALVDKTKSEVLRIKYYLRILMPLAEIYMKEENFERAKDCYKECLKLKCEHKTINWLIRRRLRKIRELTDDTVSSSQESQGALSPVTPNGENSGHILENEIAFHLEMGDSFYVCGDFNKAFDYYFELWRKFYSVHLHTKDQEYILATMGHLKLQKYSKIILSQVHDAIKFYEQSLIFYRKRKGRDSDFIKIYLLTANLLAGKKNVVKDLYREFINTQEHNKTEFFITMIHQDTDHRFLWRDLTITEREFLTNRIKPTMVNYYMLESHHYDMKLKKFLSDDPARFLRFPDAQILRKVATFVPSQLYNQNKLHLAVYIKIRTTRI